MARITNPGPANATLTKEQTFTAAQTFNGLTNNGATQLSGNVGLYGVTPVARQAAVTAPTAAPALYDQTQMTSVVNAINALRTRLSSLGVTL